jgi:uncharacterized Zn-binding protein involved in type VI secretion
MAGICVDGDYAGGTIIGSSTNVFAHGRRIALIGDTVTPHGIGPHNGAVMVSSSSKVLVNGRGVVRSGDIASCGHTASSSISDISAG